MNPAILAHDMGVEFPVMNSSRRSIKNALVSAATGGRIAAEAGKVITVSALSGLNFRIERGERVALVGHNGSGKTTLLRAMAGVYAATSGILQVDGGISSLLDIALGMDPEATGVENVFLRGIIMGMTRGQIEQEFDDIASFADLGDFLNLPVRTYSSGMLLRLAFSISTAWKTDIVLMDEWLSVGDIDFSRKASDRLNQLIENASVLVIATHSPELAQRLCTRVFKLSHGRLQDDAPMVPA